MMLGRCVQLPASLVNIVQFYWDVVVDLCFYKTQVLPMYLVSLSFLEPLL